MTETKWHEGREPRPMIEWVLAHASKGKATERKVKLWACACVRRVWILLPDERSRTGIEVRERYEDGKVTESAMCAASDAALLARGDARKHFRHAANADDFSPELAPVWAAGAASTASCGNPHGQDMAARAIACAGPGTWRRTYKQELAAQADLLRHVFGNPFRPQTLPANLPRSVVTLAEALNAGEDCVFALRDSLLDAGHPDLAEHFQNENHPKGCWAMDLILGKS